MEENKLVIEKSKICELLRSNVNNELNELLKIDDDDELLKYALNELA